MYLFIYIYIRFDLLFDFGLFYKYWCSDCCKNECISKIKQCYNMVLEHKGLHLFTFQTPTFIYIFLEDILTLLYQKNIYMYYY